MKTFYNVINAILCCAKEARASIVLDIKWVQFVLQNCEKLQNYWFKLNRVKKKNSVRGLYDKKTTPHSTAYLRREEKRVVVRGSPWARPIRKPDLGHVVQMDQSACSRRSCDLSIIISDLIVNFITLMSCQSLIS